MKKQILKLSLFLFVSFPGTAAVALQPDDVRISFSSNDGQWLQLPDPEPGNEFDLDAGKRSDGALFAIGIDLDGDGAEEYFISTLCGTGGCEYPLFAGKPGRYLGSVFGSQVWLLERKTYGLPDIETFSRSSTMIGNVYRYEFDGAHYKSTASREVRSEQEAEALFQTLKKVPKWLPHTAKP